MFTPISDNVINTMYQQMAPQANGTPMFAPGAPLRPFDGLTPQDGPRQFEYGVGYNIAELPRGTEDYSFAELRAVAKSYDAVQLCEQAWFDYVSKLELDIEPISELMGEDMDISMYEDDIQYYKNFFASPDKEHDLHSWLRMAVRDQLEIDAVAIYVRPDMIGRPYSLDLIDGATIKPLIDDRGRRPTGEFPAFEQFVYGMPSVLLRADELIYIKETEQSDSVYGRSRVERIMMKIMQAMRKQTKDLMRFTDGTVPAGVVEISPEINWTQDQINDEEIQFNNLMAGNDVMRARIKFLPRGMTFKPTDESDIHTEYDSWILNIAVACFGLTMDELAITGSSNRSVGQTQENVVYRRAISPLMNRYANLFTMILRTYFHENRFVVKWKGFEEQEDFGAKATAFATLSNAGIVSPTRAAHLMHLPVDGPDLPSGIIGAKTGPVLIEDFADPAVRQAQKDAQLAGLQLAVSNPGAKSQPDDEEEEGNASSEDVGTSGKEDEQQPPIAKRVLVSEDYRRWRDAAIHAVKAGKPVRQFSSEYIPASTLRMGYLALQRCATVVDVKQFFQEVRELVYVV